ncbi:DCN1-like protein 1, partial [Syncephalis fuscata]
ITTSSEAVATSLLKASNWNLDVAADSYFSQSNAVDSPAKAAIIIIMLLIKHGLDEDEPNKILVNGTEQYCTDLNVKPDDVVMLVIATHLKAKMCEFNRNDFIEGWRALGCDSIEAMQNALPELRDELKDPAKYKKIYEYTFIFALAPAQRVLPLEMALPLWQLLLADRFDKLDLWFTFLQEQHKKAIPKDTWNMLHEFMKDTNEDLSNYDMNDAWPPLIDEVCKFIYIYIYS